MRKLVIQLVLLLGVAGLLGGLTLRWALQRPYLDPFYTRFTTPPAGSLVLGTSRAAQAVQPAVLRARLGQRYEGPWLNYAFTAMHSPYGPSYLASIRRKLAPTAQHGLFVVAVDPWALSLLKPRQPDKAPVFPEDELMIGQLNLVNQNPNFEYLAHYLTAPLYHAFFTDTLHAVERLHRDGWLEIDLPSPTADSGRYRERLAEKLVTYRQLARTSYLAPARLQSLQQLIALLRSHGQVVLVRLPTGAGLAAIEQGYQPQFDQLMQQTGAAFGVPYLNYIAARYPTTDGNHLWYAATYSFSQRLANDIARLAGQ
ncbi:MAG: hypothetical protein ACRYF0_13350 [Janthinobacterium lividum]